MKLAQQLGRISVTYDLRYSLTEASLCIKLFNFGKRGKHPRLRELAKPTELTQPSIHCKACIRTFSPLRIDAMPAIKNQGWQTSSLSRNDNATMLIDFTL